MFICFLTRRKNLVCLCWLGYEPLLTHRRDPTTARRGYFELLGFPPGPNRTSLVNLASPHSCRESILTPGLVRTLVQHDTMTRSDPNLKPSTDISLPDAWITRPATDLSWEVKGKWVMQLTFYFTDFFCCWMGNQKSSISQLIKTNLYIKMSWSILQSLAS